MDYSEARAILAAQRLGEVEARRVKVMETDGFFSDYAVTVDRRVLVRLHGVATTLALAHQIRGNSQVADDFSEIGDLVGAITDDAVSRADGVRGAGPLESPRASRAPWWRRMLGAA